MELGPEAEEGEGLRTERRPGTQGWGGQTDRQAGNLSLKLDRDCGLTEGRARPTLHVQLSLPAVALDEDGGAQEGPRPGAHEGLQSMVSCRAGAFGQEEEGASPAQRRSGNLGRQGKKSQEGISLAVQ